MKNHKAAAGKSSNSRKLSTETLLVGIEPVVLENYEFQNEMNQYKDHLGPDGIN